MILRNIYGEMELELKKNNMEDRRREDMAYNNRMRTIFNQAVAEVMQQKAREQASSVVEISIYDAFALEMQTELGIVREHDRARYDAMLDAWIKSKVSAAMTMAQPWIGICNTVGATTMSVYLAMHPDNAVRMDNTPSVEATAARYLKEIGRAHV